MRYLTLLVVILWSTTRPLQLAEGAMDVPLAESDCATLNVKITPNSLRSVQGENPVLALQVQNTGGASVEIGGEDLVRSIIAIEFSGVTSGTMMRNDGSALPPSSWRTLPPGAVAERRFFLDPTAKPILDKAEGGEYRLVFSLRLWIRTGGDARPCEFSAPAIVWQLAAFTEEDGRFYADIADPLREKRLDMIRRPEVESGRRYLAALEEAMRRGVRAEWLSQLQAEYVAVVARLAGQNAPFDDATFDYLGEVEQATLRLGSPYCDPLLSRTYVEFFGKYKRWELLELVPGKLEAELMYRPDLDPVAVYLGGWGVMLDDPSLSIPQELQQKVEQPLLACLSKGLKGNNSQVVQSARQLLRRLEGKQKWSLLHDAASCILRNDPKSAEAKAALRLAITQMEGQ